MNAYTVSSFREITYTVVQIADGPTPDLPAPDRVPEVAQDAIPDRHRGPTSPDGSHQIVIRRRGEPDPLDADVDWIDVDAIREHRTDNPDIWEAADV